MSRNLASSILTVRPQRHSALASDDPSSHALTSLLSSLPSPKIPTDRIHEVEIPTGLPLVFNVRKKCIQVLDDGLDTDAFDPLAR